MWPDGLVPKIDEYFGEGRKMPTDFTLSASPVSAGAAAGGGAATTVTVLSLSGFHSSVGLTCAASDPAITCRVSPASVAPPVDGSAQAGLSIAISPSAAPGEYTVSIDGVSGGSRREPPFSSSSTGRGPRRSL